MWLETLVYAQPGGEESSVDFVLNNLRCLLKNPHLLLKNGLISFPIEARDTVAFMVLRFLRFIFCVFCVLFFVFFAFYFCVFCRFLPRYHRWPRTGGCFERGYRLRSGECLLKSMNFY